MSEVPDFALLSQVRALIGLCVGYRTALRVAVGLLHEAGVREARLREQLSALRCELQRYTREAVQ